MHGAGRAARKALVESGIAGGGQAGGDEVVGRGGRCPGRAAPDDLPDLKPHAKVNTIRTTRPASVAEGAGVGATGIFQAVGQHGRVREGFLLVGAKGDADNDLAAPGVLSPVAAGHDKLLAALRSSTVDMPYAVSEDFGKTWGPVRSFGFKGHCPYLLRYSGGLIVPAPRVPATSLHWTGDEGKAWHGRVRVDSGAGRTPALWGCRTAGCTAPTMWRERGRAVEGCGCG